MVGRLLQGRGRGRRQRHESESDADQRTGHRDVSGAATGGCDASSLEDQHLGQEDGERGGGKAHDIDGVNEEMSIE